MACFFFSPASWYAGALAPLRLRRGQARRARLSPGSAELSLPPGKMVYGLNELYELYELYGFYELHEFYGL